LSEYFFHDGMPILSKSCIYGIQAAIYIAASPHNEFVSIREIADKLNISFHFLTKVLQILTHKGIMTSYRGPNGGIALARPPSAISLAQVIKAIDGDSLFNECLLGLPGCGVAEPCPAHDQMTSMRSKLNRICSDTSLDVLAQRANQMHVRLSALSSLPSLSLRSALAQPLPVHELPRTGDHHTSTRNDDMHSEPENKQVDSSTSPQNMFS
jgi:Rrf2 family protein